MQDVLKLGDLAGGVERSVNIGCVSGAAVVRAEPITDEGFGKLFTAYQRSAWRLELLPQYLIPGDIYYPAFLAGEPVPPHPEGQWWKKGEAWINTIKGNVAAGRMMGRVHVLPEQLTPYLRFEIEWGYCYDSQAGDDIRLLEAGRVADDIRKLAVQDFWVFDDRMVVLCDYKPDGTWVGGRVVSEGVDVSAFLQVRELALREAIELKEFLARYRAGRYA